jgi:5'-3' exonuclease
MDCNSIIYDCVRKLEYDSAENPVTEDLIIKEVIAKIEVYVNMISPTNVLYIAFDGVAPFAKMEQQRTRRYKNTSSAKTSGFNTTAITPGTEFMNMLSIKVKRSFSTRGFGAKTVVVSGSDEPGEGEHKMFQYMRDHALLTETIAVYGLDADLIMLSLFHCFACKNIYIFRESPEFGKILLNRDFGRDELLYLDNRGLSTAILSEMEVSPELADARGRIYDYIFACFLLGNDFLPHFPALNIRTHGNFTVLETYRKLIAKYKDRRFISLETGNIQWKWVKLFLQELAKEEPKMIQTEYEARGKLEKRVYSTSTQEDRDIAFDNIPTIYRAEEHYISPCEPGWQDRYYKVAFHLSDSSDLNKSFVDRLCNNYLEGLEWTFKYYTEGCPHWRWKYNYHYPPLFADLVQRVPELETLFIDEHKGMNRPFLPSTQLAYVVPPWNHRLFTDKLQRVLKTNNYMEYYVGVEQLKFQWMFCRYFWESHVLLPEIPLAKLEKLDILMAHKQ